MTTILGIESSCDETAVAIVVDGVEIRTNIIASQASKHAQFGGVIPELAAREHLKVIDQVVHEALKSADCTLDAVDAIAATRGPGLVPALLVGYSYAKALSAATQKPLIGVNHFHAHIYGALMNEPTEFVADPKNWPMMALVVSGGHTAILKLDISGEIEVIGQTLDDAAGEAFDKAAKLLHLGYPGGPVIQKVGDKGDPKKFHFPRSLIPSGGRKVRPEDRYNFSFSGLKTALLYHCQQYREDAQLEGQLLYDTVASYQEAIVDVLATKTFDAFKTFQCQTLILAGGVACNQPLRDRFTQKIPKYAKLCIAKPVLCTDNAAMVAGLAYYQYQNQDFTDLCQDVFPKLPALSQSPIRGSVK